jgi:hypothetical protein
MIGRRLIRSHIGTCLRGNHLGSTSLSGRTIERWSTRKPPGKTNAFISHQFAINPTISLCARKLRAIIRPAAFANRSWQVSVGFPTQNNRISATLRNFRISASLIGMVPNADFEHFVRDYLQLAGQERSPELRSRLFSLAKEWMHAAMQETATQPARPDSLTVGRASPGE